MKLSFQSFYHSYQLLVEGSADYTITHIEDLDIEAFIRVIETLEEYNAVQKLDGANLRVGLDENGNLYTSREQKGGKRFYHESDFPKNSAYDGFRAAHLVCKKAEGYFSQALMPGESVNLEIIYGSQPNTVYYGKNDLNYIALLELLPGDDPTIEPDQGKLKELFKLLKELTLVVRSVFNDTTDGITIVRTTQPSQWKFTRSDIVAVTDIQRVDLKKELGELKQFLSIRNSVAQSQGRELTNFELLKDRSRDLSDERKVVQDQIMTDHKMIIKKKLLDLVYQQKPSLRGDITDKNTYEGIEGIIFTHPSTREKFKVVDKDVFLAVNKFNYEIRHGITNRILTTDESLSIESRGGIVGITQFRATRLFNIPGIELPSQTRKVLMQFKGDSKEETIHNICKSLHQLNFDGIKRKLQAIYIAALDDLEEALDSFKQNVNDYNLKLKNGQTIKYTKEIQRRTLLVFAENRRRMIESISLIRRADDTYDLVEMFFNKQITRIHQKVIPLMPVVVVDKKDPDEKEKDNDLESVKESIKLL